MPPLFYFFNDTATTEIYTLSLHDALPIFALGRDSLLDLRGCVAVGPGEGGQPGRVRTLDRKSTRLNSSHSQISYAVFCLKKKNRVRCPAPSRGSPTSAARSPWRRWLPPWP